MSKRSEQAAYNYAKENGTLGYDYNQIYDAAKNGYEQAEKDIIASIREQVKQWMPEKDGEEYTDGKRLAFNSVLHLLEEIENYG